MKKPVLVGKTTWHSLISNVRQFISADKVGTKAKWLFLLLIFFLFGINGLNVLNSYVGRDFMTAIEDRNRAEFIRMALFYIGVFAASTIVAVSYHYAEERLGLLWRRWATKQALISYADNRVYHRLKLSGEIGNPDQRIADDIRTFSVTTLSFILMVLNGSFTVIAFSGVLWSISPMLFVVSVLYASAGTFLTFILGRPLARLNFDQLDKEANFRGSLIYLRGNAESVAISRREGHLIQLALKNLDDLARNFRSIIAINRNVNFFITGYNWMIQIIPALIIAPLFINGTVKFGVITQSAIAFTQLLGAFSLIVTQFQSISSYTAVLARLSSLIEAAEREKATLLSETTYSVEEGRVAYQDLTVYSAHSGRLLIKRLSVSIDHGTRVLVRGSDESARAALLHSTIGLWHVHEGHIVRPSLDQIMVITELPYLPPGTLRELLLGPWPEQGAIDRMESIRVSEDRIIDILSKLKIEWLVARFGGLDNRQHWENCLPLEDQQFLVLARVLLVGPRFAFLEKPGTTLDPEQLDWILEMLTKRSITYVTFEDQEGKVNPNRYDMLLELQDAGAWSYKPIKDAKIINFNSAAA
ncbi:ABC transporter, permease family protein [uncultured Desulfobacterium sp.]|uniref:ABC transporter, permease family protein n=1 Tax=uncultured Desulfobacterium sp. TaxID=201089 RepID=A0A445MRI0_9BACT|nr:ABC transporter, permease family protein [uncultured Desulfobacterium sp.]